jgi:glucan phosphorylase
MNSPENIRTGLSTDEIEQAFRDNLSCGMGRLEATATKHDLYVALALTVRDRLFEHTVEGMEDYGGANARRVAYLSAEYLPGPHLASNLTEVKGVAYDTPILGYRVETCNILRLWKAEAVESFDFAAFNLGDYDRAVEEKVASETITKVLYPNDEAHRGKELRLKQQFFFTSCSLQDMLRIHALLGGTPATFDKKWAVQLNGTHPAVAVAELMRLLVDEYGLDWDQAWTITGATLAYTNHTLLPEALEKWTVDLFGALLPRHLEIVFEINRRGSIREYCERVWRVQPACVAG